MDIAPLSWSALLLTITLLLILYFVLFNPWRQKKNGKLLLPPGPPPLPILGNLLQLGKKPNESLWALSLQYGPLMTLSLGMKTTVVVSSPAMAKDFLKTHDHIFAGRKAMAASKSFPDHKSSMIFRPYGADWRKVRRIATTELFSHSRLLALQHLRRDQVFLTLRQIFDDQGKPLSIGHQAFYTSLNLLGNMIFSTSVFDPRNPASADFKDTVWRVMKIGATPNLVDFFPFLGFMDPQGLCREMSKHVKGMHSFFDAFIQNRVATRHKSPEKIQTSKDFLDVLLDCRAENFSLEDIKALLLEIFLAGSETTATTIEWGMAELIRNPKIMKRVQHELDEKVGLNRRVEGSDIEHLPYLCAVVKEVFRLHPAAPLLVPHKAESSCEVGGYLIPKDAEVLVNVWAMGRDAAIWTDPFMEGRNSNMDFRGHDWELIPFPFHFFARIPFPSCPQ